ncbi:phosphoribosylaminoimidazole-succinocarboxamide synthase [Metarhizium album ARSEF 1941]|uniref:Phosphoribosylaminoimidazole-succinocarboxamide synthase n=1 Tax=Metarhizium album (strain ARSEF 1941) TaxID=1081103 RepID=A0A0B2X465_METAS|nr:phosphoribosylaminoimidazole-succinocarboxamide synthase [Metarhizium album ARSEF 1941]KHO00210.1 phosphoribosylaminoimidazole-succinocarboxamide synthase [Metarhizium album ARSEF 1941]
MAALTTISLPSLQKIASGKVRDLFSLPDPDALLFVASDRLSAFDVVMANGVPNKGAILTLMSAHWFRVLSERIPNLRTHFISLDIPEGISPEEASAIKNRSMQVRKLDVLKIEAIVRGYITGGAWKEYQAKGTVHGLAMPQGMQLSQKFPRAIYTPSTKADAGAHDENIHPDDAWKEIGDKETAKKVEELALEIYNTAAAYAEERGIIIADTKFEFARDTDGNIYLVDEVLTPDSSRFWPKDRYELGKEQDSFDKQFVRNWLIREGLKAKEGVALPEDICVATEERYKDAFYLLTGTKFEDAAEK